jgi:hypothetical protein
MCIGLAVSSAACSRSQASLASKGSEAATERPAPPSTPDNVDTSKGAPTSVVAPEPELDNDLADGLSPYERAVEKIFARAPAPKSETDPWAALGKLGCLSGLQPVTKKVERALVLGGDEPRALTVYLRADTNWGDAVLQAFVPQDSDGSEYSPDEFREAILLSTRQINSSPGDSRNPKAPRDLSEVLELSNGAAAQLNQIVGSGMWYGTLQSGRCSVSMQMPMTTDRALVIEVLNALSAK